MFRRGTYGYWMRWTSVPLGTPESREPGDMGDENGKRRSLKARRVPVCDVCGPWPATWAVSVSMLMRRAAASAKMQIRVCGPLRHGDSIEVETVFCESANLVTLVFHFQKLWRDLHRGSVLHFSRLGFIRKHLIST